MILVKYYHLLTIKIHNIYFLLCGKLIIILFIETIIILLFYIIPSNSF